MLQKIKTTINNLIKFYKCVINDDLRFYYVFKEETEMSMAVTAPTIFELPEELKQSCSTERKPTGMSDTERQEFTERIRGLSDEELEIIIDNIPVELCLKRIDRELTRAHNLEQEIAKTMNLFKSTSA